MQTDNALAIREAAILVDQCKKDVATVLVGTGAEYVKIHAEAALTKLSARLHHLAGSAPEGSDKPTEFAPITSFMGEPIVAAGSITADDLEPGEADRVAYLARVEKLEAEIETIAPAGIINAFTTADDQLVLRGVAKRAGVENYADAEITEAFIEAIVAGLNEKREAAKADAAVDAELAAMDANGTADTIPVDESGKTATEPPATEPPATEPPATEPEPPATEPPATEPEPPATEPPATEPKPEPAAKASKNKKG